MMETDGLGCLFSLLEMIFRMGDNAPEHGRVGCVGFLLIISSVIFGLIGWLGYFTMPTMHRHDIWLICLILCPGLLLVGIGLTMTLFDFRRDTRDRRSNAKRPGKR